MTAALRGTETGLQSAGPTASRRSPPSAPTHPCATIEPVPGVWSRLHSALDFTPRQQVTRLGLLFTLTWVLVALAAFASANNLLFLILAVLLATLLISGFISRLSLAGLELDFQVPDHICAGRKLIGRVVIRNTKTWMPSFSIHVTASSDSGLSAPLYFPVIPGGTRVETQVELFFARRGSYRQNSFQLSTRFPFGFAERRLNVPLRRDVLVYPAIDPKPGFEDLLVTLQGEIASFYRGQGHDFYRIRPYEVLESARHVDWKATAHTGDLQVREFARDQEQTVAFFLDLMPLTSSPAGSNPPWIVAHFLPGICPSAGRACDSALRKWTGSFLKKPTCMLFSNTSQLFHPGLEGNSAPPTTAMCFKSFSLSRRSVSRKLDGICTPPISVYLLPGMLSPTKADD